MKVRLPAAAVPIAALLSGLALAGGASAARVRLAEYKVPTGGFALALPSTWVDVTSAAPQVLQQLEKVPSFRQFAQEALATGALKLIAADPSSEGRIYMDVGVERVGPVTTRKVASATVAEIKRSAGGKIAISSTPFVSAAGKGMLLHASSPKKGTSETDEFLIVHDQVEYVLVFIAPKTSWNAFGPVFEASARTFHFVMPPALGKYVLKASQVGRGYKQLPFPDGTSFIGEPTLDLCAGSYPSENLRTGRIQVRYLKAKGAGVSNEVVSYVPGGAQQAITEVANEAKSCARKPVVIRQNGVTTTYKATLLQDPKLLSGAVVVKIDVKATDGKRHVEQKGIAVYQAHGNTFSGVYTFAGNGSTLSQAIKLGLHAAEQAAQNLQAQALAA
jgi:hypothetical protein